MRLKLLLVSLALSASAQLRAETVYVTDMLRLGLYRSEDASGSPVRNLTSGTALEVLERVPNYARVRTPEGDEGWVKSVFLVAEKPARAELQELQQRLDSSTAELAQTRSALEAAEAEVERLKREAVSNGDSAAAITETMGRLKSENQAYEAELERFRGSVPLVWAGAALLVALIGGFVGGLWWLDALIRRRHGGFRIY